MNYRKRRAEHAHIDIDRAAVERVESFTFLGVHVTKDISSSTVMESTTALLLPRTLKRFCMRPQILNNNKKLYSCTIESILTGCISTGNNGNCLATDRKSHSHPGPLYQAFSKTPAAQATDFALLQHGKSGTNTTLNSFFTQAIRLLNKTAK
jgi:hypothetical protein